MRPGGGKQKGGDFERTIARELSRWFTKGERDDIFWRSHNSGAMGSRSKFKNETGDIMSIDELGRTFTNRYNIECRHSKGVRIEDLVYGNQNAGVRVFIKEGLAHCGPGQKLFGLMKEDRHDVLVLMEYEDWLEGYRDFHLVRSLFDDRFVLILWNDFKTIVSPDLFKGKDDENSSTK